MQPDDARHAVAAGRLPRGGPSELAAHGLTGDVPAGYWQRWATAASVRIRAQVQRYRESWERPWTP